MHFPHIVSMSSSAMCDKQLEWVDNSLLTLFIINSPLVGYLVHRYLYDFTYILNTLCNPISQRKKVHPILHHGKP